MSETMNQDTHAGAGSKRAPLSSEVRVRLWPAILIVFAHLAATFGFLRFGSTSLHNVLGAGVAPAVAALLLMLWWLTASRVPWRDRLIGLALFIAAIPWIVFTQKSNGEMLLMLALPVMTTGVVGLLTITCWLRWPVRRRILVVFMAGCAGGFMALRVDSVTGDFTPIMAWRWSPTAEGRATALVASKVQGTAVLPAQPGPGDWPGFHPGLSEEPHYHRAGIVVAPLIWTPLGRVCRETPRFMCFASVRRRWWDCRASLFSRWVRPSARVLEQSFEGAVVIGLANDYIGYLVNEPEYAHGGYEVESRSYYGPGLGAFLAEQAGKIAGELTPK